MSASHRSAVPLPSALGIHDLPCHHIKTLDAVAQGQIQDHEPSLKALGPSISRTSVCFWMSRYVFCQSRAREHADAPPDDRTEKILIRRGAFVLGIV